MTLTRLPCVQLQDLRSILYRQSVLRTLWSSAILCFRGPFPQLFNPLYRHLFILLYCINQEIDEKEVQWPREVNSRLFEEPGKDVTLDSRVVITQIIWHCFRRLTQPMNVGGRLKRLFFHVVFSSRFTINLIQLAPPFSLPQNIHIEIRSTVHLFFLFVTSVRDQWRWKYLDFGGSV